MNLDGPSGFTIGLLIPFAILAIAAVVVPQALFARMPPTLGFVYLNLLLSFAILVVAAAFLFAGLYMFQGADVATAIAQQPLGAVREFIWLGLSSALIWCPVLAIVLFGLAQKTEVSDEASD